MPRDSAKVIVVLVLLSLLAIFALHVLSLRNGMVGKIIQNIHSSHPILPGSDHTLWTTWTGLSVLDLDFGIMVSVFTAVLDKNNISLFLQANHFFGLWMSIWISILLESYRQGPNGVFKKFVFWGLVMEFAGVAVGAPAWFAAHLAEAGPVLSDRGGSMVPWEDLRLLPWSYLIGLVIPTIGMMASRQAASDRRYSSQTWILVRLFHPALTFIVHKLLQAGTVPAKDKKNVSRDAAYSTARMKQIYAVAFWLSAVPHILVLSTVSLVYLFPSRVPTQLAQGVSFASIWQVSSIWQSIHTMTETIQTGVATFMTANELISSAAFVIWAWELNRRALQQAPHKKYLRLGLAEVVLTGIVVGPGATAITLLENRDKILGQTPKHYDNAKQA